MEDEIMIDVDEVRAYEAAVLRAQAADPRIAKVSDSSRATSRECLSDVLTMSTKIENLYDGLSWLDFGVEEVDAAAHQHEAAFNAVYNTLELFECILSHLPNRKLVLATGVSRGWRKFIFESPTLRKKLFLEPSQEPPFEYEYCRLFRDDIQVSDFFPSGYLYMESDEEKAANDYEFADMSDAEVERFYLIYGENPPMATRFKLVTECPLLEHERRHDDHPAWERKVRHINRRSTRPSAWLGREWLGDESRNFRMHAVWAGQWKEMYLTSPPVERVVVDFTWTGENPQGVFKRVEGRRAVVRREGIKCEDIYTGYLDVEEGELTTYTTDPKVKTEMITFAGISFDPGVETQETPRTCLDRLASAGFKMKQELNSTSYMITIPGVVIPTPAELATMRLPMEVLEEDHKRLYAYQEFMLTTREMQADGEHFEDNHYLESLPVEMVYPEECAQWEERVEQATMWKERASRRWKK
jgi:hypothetical protein